mmetsp:Transcript_69104/g.186765  ORF Transcript_69104/g.186765 Transcript_69104/m.186765 type:complete len:327 (-) Transcript_69104:64-1044(-)
MRVGTQVLCRCRGHQGIVNVGWRVPHHLYSQGVECVDCFEQDVLSARPCDKIRANPHHNRVTLLRLDSENLHLPLNLSNRDLRVKPSIPEDERPNAPLIASAGQGAVGSLVGVRVEAAIAGFHAPACPDRRKQLLLVPGGVVPPDFRAAVEAVERVAERHHLGVADKDVLRPALAALLHAVRLEHGLLGAAHLQGVVGVPQRLELLEIHAHVPLGGLHHLEHRDREPLRPDVQAVGLREGARRELPRLGHPLHHAELLGRLARAGPRASALQRLGHAACPARRGQGRCTSDPRGRQQGAPERRHIPSRGRGCSHGCSRGRRWKRVR